MDALRTAPQVWVGCLACYNGGHLFGGWIDATEAEDAWAEGRLEVASLASVRVLHVAERHEEWWCFDTEGFGGILGECSPVEAQRVAVVIDRVDANPDELGAFFAFVRNVGTEELDDLPDQFREAYQGCWESVGEYAADLAAETCPSPEMAKLATAWPYRCIDWSFAGNELVLGGDIWTATADRSVYVFRAL